MKKFFKSMGLISILFLSFFYTEKIALIMQNKSPIMQNIENNSSKYTVNPVNATINDTYVIPGIRGRMVNKNKSFVNMKTFGVFNEYYLIFEDIKPDISLEDNLDKIIKYGNKKKNAIAFILEDGNEDIKNYFKTNNIKASLLINETTYDKFNYFEQINNDLKKYKNVESLLNKNNQNKNICYIKNINKSTCLKEGKYLVEESFALTSNNIVDVKKELDSGSIILIKNNTSIDYINLLIKEINFKGFNILTLYELINEKEL